MDNYLVGNIPPNAAGITQNEIAKHTHTALWEYPIRFVLHISVTWSHMIIIELI